jgi:hypothetical protein
MIPRLGLVNLSNIDSIPRNFVQSQNARNLQTQGKFIIMTNQFNAVGLDWTVQNYDGTSTNSLTVDVDGLQYLVAGGGIIESHTNEPFNSFHVSGLSTNCNIRISGANLASLPQ